MPHLLALGLNHTTAPLELRERVAFDASQRQAALMALAERFPGIEAVLLSTCNRVELYAGLPDLPSQPGAAALVEFLSSFHRMPAEALRPHLYEKSNRAMVEHLFAVASSLDSMVLGESQILGQVREAYDAAAAAKTVGPLLHPLMQRATAVGKQVMATTALGEGRLSIASVAVDFARRIFERFNDKAVLCVGAGKMAQLVLGSFAALSPGQLLVCNRDGDRAAALAARFNGQAVPFEQLNDALIGVDVVITSTGAARPIFTESAFAAAHRKRRRRPIFIIDIALPRDVEPAIGSLENVYLYNVDDLQQVISDTQAGRRGAIEAARRIVAAAVEDYHRSHRARELGPAIEQLYQRYHALAAEELERTLAKLPGISESEREHLAELTRRLVNKLLHDPVTALRSAEGMHGPAGQYLHAMERLFGLKPGEQNLRRETPE
jgi:glutamyl-tRNA reductase